ncbi:hypothetical protein D9V29_11660 [Mycetocola manganoxydans]|uniref:Uncharacterized protein n=1 Tax=Mycetocola manganoxydans TaxID=699879 RepID=A0A3L6ZNC4_9MICO|nr:hypothetical protein [Mycetocola manganoxydans]RLP69373.1 hypothetical protein D9V29_11660 [Mycetocola manganoxydans]GHD50833.1 hypothetical protein GCM10008097_25250 [Mycetocola manganoxydans]
MGTNKRYAVQYDKLMKRRVTEVLIKPKPVSLSAAEIDAEHDPVIAAQKPIPVRAWARYPETPARVEGRAIAWTTRAVQIEWEDSGGVTQRAWVWASAVDKL